MVHFLIKCPYDLKPIEIDVTFIPRTAECFRNNKTINLLSTSGVSLSDSPAGLAAYIMEKMAICTNRDQLDTPHGGLEGLDLDDVLDTITIMWANNAIVTSMRIYAEGVSKWQESEINILHR